MEFISGKKDFEMKGASNIVTLGKFDGIHLGHQKLMKELLREKENGYQAGVFTFELSDLTLLRRSPVRQLFTSSERADYLKNLGIDWLVEYPFDDETKNMTPLAFIQDVLVMKLHAKIVVVGEDFRFGKDREGDCAFLKRYEQEFGYQTRVIRKETDESGKEISSTYIREEISAGHMEKAASLFGYPYFIRGIVVHGLGLAVKLGFPTMNLIPDQDKLLPPYGVYCSTVQIDGICYGGITNIGCKPTVSDQKIPWVENYLWDYDGDAYGKEITVRICHFCRPEKTFDSTKELVRQMEQDVLSGKEFYRHFSSISD